MAHPISKVVKLPLIMSTTAIWIAQISLNFKWRSENWSLYLDLLFKISLRKAKKLSTSCWLKQKKILSDFRKYHQSNSFMILKRIYTLSMSIWPGKIFVKNLISPPKSLSAFQKSNCSSFSTWNWPNSSLPSSIHSNSSSPS